MVAPEAVPPRLRLSLIRDAEAQALGQVLRTTEEELTLQVKVAAEPPYPAPVQASFALEGAEGVTLVAEPFEVKDETTATLRLRWPSAPGDRASLTLVATAQSATPAVGRHTVHLQHPVSLLRRYLGWALILLAVISVVAYVLQRRFRAYMEARMGKRQLRGIDAQGKISVERYSFLENSREDEVVEIAPELTQSSVELIVEDDGSVRASVSGRAKLVHERDPTRFVETTPLKHGDSFAVVEGNRARRFVYLEDEPSAEELERSVAADRETAEAELRDSGVYVLLDEHQNVAPLASVIDPASEHLFPSADELDPYPTPSERLDRAVSDDFDGWPSASERMERVDDSPALPRPTVGLADDDDLVLDDDLLEDSVDELAFVPTSEDGPMVSDEGVVWLGSDEAEILDSDEAAAIDADTDVSDLPKGL
ncbi:MAG: hypothetical protein R3F62_02325 [Planctomycetota bacterium]